ncbi:hypothetical protein, partial [Citrobacter freundii]|uniref:hypothetical protein n=1 Tax=Citrobacter freundii TaxID=546 RepID=UPI001CE39BAE
YCFCVLLFFALLMAFLCLMFGHSVCKQKTASGILRILKESQLSIGEGNRIDEVKLVRQAE